MPKGIVYILTNPCLDGWVKIGMTERNDIQRRLNELNNPPNIPLMFRAYALYHVDDPKAIEHSIHKLIDLVDNGLHARETLASGKIREREFFQMSPERAYQIFREVAELRGDADCLEMVTATEQEAEEEELVTSRRPPFRFSMVGIETGAELAFIRDDSITAVVASDKTVTFEETEWSLSGLASELYHRINPANSNRAFGGPQWFTYKGEVLSDRRNRMERESE